MRKNRVCPPGRPRTEPHDIGRDSDPSRRTSSAGRESRDGDQSLGVQPQLHLHMVGLTPVRRLGALKARLLKGRPMKISAAQLKWLYKTVSGKSPL